MLAIKDVYPKLLACMKTVVGEDYPVIGTSGKIGISWGHSGGEASGLFTENYLAADGIENVIRVLEDMEDQKFTNLRFVELNACNGGCVGGVLTVENPYVAEVKLKRLRKYMPVARSHMHESEENVIKWTTGVQYEPVFRLGNNMMESFSRLNQVERLMKKFPGLDCGSCGAPTVRPWQRILSGGMPMRRTVFTICGKTCTSCRRKWPCWQTTCITETEGDRRHCVS